MRGGALAQQPIALHAAKFAHLPKYTVEINFDTRGVYKYCTLEKAMVWFGQFLYLTGWAGECLYYLLQLASRGEAGTHKGLHILLGGR